MPSKKLSISLYPRAEAFAKARGDTYAGDNVSGAVNRSLERYEAILDDGRSHLLEILSENEMALVLDVLNGTMFADTISIHLVWVEVKDGIQLDGLDKKWNINGAALVEKIKSLPYPEKCALIDASERWWNFVASGNQPGWLDTLKR
jgi:hypothetical protein